MRKSTSNNDPQPWLTSSRKRGERKNNPRHKGPPKPEPMTKKQVLAWWKHTQMDEWWKTQMPLANVSLDHALGVSEHTVLHMLNYGKNERVVVTKIARVIPAIEARRIVFPLPPRPFHWNSEYEQRCRPRCIRVDAPEKPPVIEKLCDEHLWSLWAVCSGCGHNQFMPVAMDGKLRAACYHCVPPKEYPKINAFRVEKSLIHEAIRRYY